MLLNLSFSCYGQDSLFIKFRHINAAISSESNSQINDFFEGRKPERILISSNFSSQGSPSRNRILADLRLFVIRSNFLNRGLPSNIITTTLELGEESNKNNNVKIVVFFAPKKGLRVLRKSPVIQVNEFDFVNRGESENTSKDNLKKSDPPSIDTEPEIKLDEAAFKKDATVSLPNLIFIGSTHYFLSGSERILRALLKVMKSRTDIEIELQGHVCCNPPGVDAYDKGTGRRDLSVMRAKAVYNYLINGGIPASRMTYKGFGSSNRLYPEEKNAREEMLNRRVEVLITASD